MIKHILPLPVALSVAVSLSAQAPLLDPVRIEHPWPTTLPIGDKALVCGEFLPGHPGRWAIALRGDGSLATAWQPAVFEHAVEVGDYGGVAIGTLQAAAGGSDALAHVSSAGLQVLRYDQEVGFESAIGQAPLPSWGTVQHMDVYLSPAGAPMIGNYVVGWDAGSLRVAFVTATDLVIALSSFPAPVGASVLDATFVEWDGDGYPEVAVLTTTGLFVINYLGQFLAADPESSDAGKITRLRVGGQPAVARVRRYNTGFAVRSCIRIATGGMRTFDGGSIELPEPGPTGLTPADLDGNSEAEVIVSCQDSIRRILPGSVNGPLTQGPLRVDLLDVRAVSLPAIPPPNLAPLVVDDIDRNGAIDFVIAQTATNQLVVMKDGRPQVQLLGLGNSSDDGGAVEPVVLSDVLGHVTEPGGWVFEGSQIIGSDALALRLAVPDWATGDLVLDVFVYEVEQGANAQTDDPVSPDAIGYYRFPLPAECAGGEVDIMVPVADIGGLPSEQLGRLLAEVNLLQMENGAVVASAPALFSSQMMVPDTAVLLELEPQIITMLSSVVGNYPYFDVPAAFDEQVWIAGASTRTGMALWPPSGSPPVGSGTGLPGRYIGFVPPVGPAPKGSSQLPKIPPMKTVSNAVNTQQQ